MPVIIFMVAAAIASILLAGVAMVLVYVVLPLTAIGLLIWLGVHLYQQDQKENARLEEDQRKHLQQQREQGQLLANKIYAEAHQKLQADITQVTGEWAGQIYADMLPKGQGQFQIPLSLHPIVNTMVAKMLDPWWDKNVVEHNVGNEVRDRIRYGAENVGSKEVPVWPKDYTGKDPHKVYLTKETWPLFDQLVPFSFADRDRFTHHWCLGDNGTGKTTYLRHLIDDDLYRAHKEECSLVVMDSKKLIREMRMLTAFALQNPLATRLTLIDADERFPLNPFCLPPAQAHSVVSYMLANLSGMSDLQTGAFSFLIDAAMAYPNPTLRTIRNFFALKVTKGEIELPEHFDKMDEDTKFWFTNTFAKLHPATREGIQQRLTNFLKQNPLLDRMISADSFALDMGLLNKGGHVLLVDTNLAEFSEEGANVFGRLIIALINQLSSQRSKQDENKLKPIFVYIDEAQDYIRDDAMFSNILEKARAQKIAMTVAHHHKKQIDARVEASLENSGIKSECHDLGSVSVKTRRISIILPVEKLEFNLPVRKMSDNEYHDLREHLRVKYPYTVPPKQPDPNDDELVQKF